MPETNEAPLMTLKPAKAGRRARLVKNTMLFAALSMILVGAFMPQFGVDDPVAQYVLYGIGVMEVGLAFVLPKFIAMNMKYDFYADRLVLNGGALSVPYDEIKSVEERRDPALAGQGVTDLIIHTTGEGDLFDEYVVEAVPSLNSPAARIGELLAAYHEKSG